MKPTLKRVNNKNMKKNKNTVHISDTSDNLYIRDRHGIYIIETVYPKKKNVDPHMFAMVEAFTKGNKGYHRTKDWDLRKLLPTNTIKVMEANGLIVTAKYIRLNEGRTFKEIMLDMAKDAILNRLPKTIEYK